MVDTNLEFTKAALKARREYMRAYKKTMTEEQKAQQKAYMKEWRKNNKDKVRKNYLNYWERKARKMAGEKS